MVFTVCTTLHPSTSSTSASLSPVSPPDNIFALPAEVFSSCLAIVSAVMVGGFFSVASLAIWNWLPDSVSRDFFKFKRSLKTFFLFLAYSCIHSALELFGRYALQIYLFTYLLTLGIVTWLGRTDFRHNRRV